MHKGHLLLLETPEALSHLRSSAQHAPTSKRSNVNGGALELLAVSQAQLAGTRCCSIRHTFVLVFIAILVAVVIGVADGILLTRYRALRGPVSASRT
jgi:ABC-type phosphate transport system permease subunit